MKKQDEQAIAEARAEITYLAQDLEDGVLPALTASAFVSAAAAGAFVTAEQADAQTADDREEDVEELNLEAVAEDIDEPSNDDAASDASTETAPLSQVELDDKTREIELPDKSDNELF